MPTSDADLRLGDWRDVLADVECDALITDPPYGARTHEGHNRVLRHVPGSSERRVECADGARRTRITYASWDNGDVAAFVGSWAPRTRGWFVALTSHDLYWPYRSALEAEGRYVFHPLPIVIPGMTVRMCGDGPSSWAVWAVVSRPRSAEFASWGALPGAYVVRKEGGQVPTIAGVKPLDLMRAIVRDYSRKGDTVCDPCAGYATTGVAALGLDRKFIGAEIDPDTHAKAVARLSGGVQKELFVDAG